MVDPSFSFAPASMMRVVKAILLCLVALAHAAPKEQPDCTGLKAVNPNCQPNEATYQREYFYIGGRKINSTGDIPGTIVVDQLYVEKLIPKTGVKKAHPIVFFHGGGSGGVIWLQTPDNRKGWASYFLDLGYAVYIVDQTSVGRSTQNDLEGYPLRIGSTVEVAEIGFSVPEISNTYPQSQLHTQWPG
ncbi:MAG: hypothetical protein Q9183_005312, partial [Haloplaca sp. 2 TL-2023]